MTTQAAQPPRQRRTLAGQFTRSHEFVGPKVETKGADWTEDTGGRARRAYSPRTERRSGLKLRWQFSWTGRGGPGSPDRDGAPRAPQSPPPRQSPDCRVRCDRHKGDRGGQDLGELAAIASFWALNKPSAPGDGSDHSGGAGKGVGRPGWRCISGADRGSVAVECGAGGRQKCLLTYRRRTIQASGLSDEMPSVRLRSGNPASLLSVRPT